MHAWRLRRVDWLRPMDAEVDHRVSADLDRVIQWAQSHDERGPIALMTMGSQHDYAARYHLSMALRGVEVVNLSDPRVCNLDPLSVGSSAHSFVSSLLLWLW